MVTATLLLAQIKRQNSPMKPQFLLAYQEQDPTTSTDALQRHKI
ncbi:hypothetical protein [Coleofasciculus sp. H7-2]